MNSPKLVLSALFPLAMVVGCSGRGPGSPQAPPTASVRVSSQEQLLEEFAKGDSHYIARSIETADPENLGDALKLGSVLTKLRPELCDDSLKVASTGTSVRTRAMAGRILGMLDPSDYRGTLLLALAKDRDQLVRRLSIPSLSTYWKYPQIRAELRKIGATGHQIDGPLANLVGAQQGDELALNRLIESAFRSGSSEYRVIVVQMLGTQKANSSAMTALQKLKKDPDSRIRAAAAAELDR